MSALRPLPLAAAALLLAGAVSSEEGEQIDKAKYMELMQKYGQPNENHERLETQLGTWDVELELFSPGGPPMKGTGTAETKWLLEGRFLHETLKGHFGPMPYEAHMILGWDNYKKKHVGCVVNNMSTGVHYFEGGVVDPTHKVQVAWQRLDEYLTGEHDKMVKIVTREKTADHYVVEIFDMSIGENGKVVIRFTYKRRKDEG